MVSPWKVKYVDADGRQVKETLGREPEWNRRKAERTLGARLAAVDKGMRKPRRRTFADLADEFVDVGLDARPRKKSTVIDYKATLRNHLRPAFDGLDLEQVVAVTRGLRAVRGQQDRRRPLPEDRKKPPGPRGPDVQDGAAVAVGQ